MEYKFDSEVEEMYTTFRRVRDDDIATLEAMEKYCNEAIMSSDVQYLIGCLELAKSQLTMYLEEEIQELNPKIENYEKNIKKGFTPQGGCAFCSHK